MLSVVAVAAVAAVVAVIVVFVCCLFVCLFGCSQLEMKFVIFRRE